MRKQLQHRLAGLPEQLRLELKRARTSRGWSQTELGKQVGLPQMHISAIETGKIVPRYDTLLDIVRVLDFDLLLVPKSLVPMVHSLVRDRERSNVSGEEARERPLYAIEDEESENES